MVGTAMATSDAVDLMVAGFEHAGHERTNGQSVSLAWLHDTDDGTRVVVYRMAFGNARLCVGPVSWLTYDAGYCYSGVAAATLAAVEWIAAGRQGEPAGWKKNLQTGEFREEMESA